MRRMVCGFCVVACCLAAGKPVQGGLIDGFEDGDTTNNPAWTVVYGAGPHFVDWDPARPGNRVLHSHGSDGAHHIITTSVSQSWQGFVFEVEFMRTGNYGPAFVVNGSGYRLGTRFPIATTDSFANGRWYIADNANNSPEWWSRDPGAPGFILPAGEWVRIRLMHSTADGLIHGRITRVSDGAVLAERTYAPSTAVPASQITSVEIGIEETPWQYVDNIRLAANTDCNANGTPDDFEGLPDCNANGTADACEIAGGTGADCNGNGVPDECEVLRSQPPTDGLVIWLRSDVGITMDGSDRVMEWSDQSSQAHHFSQSLEAARPTVLAGPNEIQNLPIVSFNGIDDFLSTPDNILPASQFTVITVMSLMNGSYPWAVGPDNVNVFYEGYPYGGVPSLDYVDIGHGFGNDARASYAGIGDPSWKIMSITGDGSISSTRVFVNGVAADTALAPGASDLVWSFGAGASIGHLAGYYSRVEFAEFLVYERALLASERQQVERYLDQKYFASSIDCNANGTPDECESLADCNANGTLDACEITTDCNTNSTPDDCDLDNRGAGFGLASSWTAFDPGANGIGVNPRGYLGTAFDGRFVYFAPYHNGNAVHGEVLRLDTSGGFTNGGSWATYDPGANGVGADADGYLGAVFDGQWVYFVPHHNGTQFHGEVLRYEPQGGFNAPSSWTTFDAGANGVGIDPDGYAGAIFDGRFIYFAPYHNGTQFHGEVLRYDTGSDFVAAASWSTFDPGASGVGTTPLAYSGGAFDGRYAYLAPLGSSDNRHGEVLRYDTSGGFASAGSWNAYDPGANGVGTGGIGYQSAVFDGRFVYFSPFVTGPNTPNGEVLRFDTTGPFNSPASWAVFDPSSSGLDPNLRGFWEAIFDGRFIYFVPRNEPAWVLRYDTAGPFSLVSSWMGFSPGASGVGTSPGGYVGGAFDGRHIYLSPYADDVTYHGEVMRFDAGATGSFDCDANGIPDECELPVNDCNANGTLDACEGLPDCNGNAMPDECELVSNDCNTNGLLDACEIAAGTSTDCNSDGTPDECELATGDCNANGTLDVCEGLPDCNTNGTPDACDIAGGTSTDCNTNGTPDECDMNSNRLVWRQKVTPVAPSHRGHHAMAYDAVRHVTVLFGGYDGDPDAETWEWNGNDWTLRTSGVPAGRWNHALTYDSGREVTVLFGGHSGCCDDAGDTWEWNGTTWALRSTTGPAPRNWHAMTYDSTRGVSVLFGGYAGEFNQTQFGDTWEWNGTTWGLRATTGPSPRGNLQMVFDSARGVTVLFGGGGGNQYLGDTWEWDGNVWTSRSTTGPSSRIDYAMIYDATRGVTVLFGGGDSTGGFQDTWEWDGATWEQRVLAGPTPGNYTMAYDIARQEMVLFGSIESASNPHTWILAPASRDCDMDGIPDECLALEDDCNSNGVVDSCEEIADCNFNQTPDECESLADCDADGTPDVCQTEFADCNTNGLLDACEIAAGSAADCNVNTTPDACEIAGGAADCNANGTLDACEAQPDCNANGILDECDIAGGTSSDCDANGVPDACEGSGMPTACGMLGAVSRRNHAALGSRGIAVNVAGRVQDANVTSESRGGGIQELRVIFHIPPGGPGPCPITLFEQTCPGGTQADYHPYSGVSAMSSTVQGTELVLTFTPGLENRRTYKVEIGPDVTSIAGQAIEVRSLRGDVNDDGWVDALDRSVIIGVWTGSGFSAKTDLDLSGTTDAVDRSMVVGAWTGGQNCAP